MRENPEWRLRNLYVKSSFELHKLMIETRDRARDHSHYAPWLIAALNEQIRQFDNLHYPIDTYRDQVPREIED